MEFGSQIRNKRQELNLSQGQVANHLYVSRKSVSHWENGNTFPDISTLIKLSNYFQISLDPLIKEDTNMEENLKKREFKRVSGWPIYILEVVFIAILFVSIAGLLARILNPFITFFLIFILDFIGLCALIPMGNLREKYYLNPQILNKLWVWFILGVVLILIGIPITSNVNLVMGAPIIGAGIGSFIGGIINFFMAKKIHQKS